MDQEELNRLMFNAVGKTDRSVMKVTEELCVKFRKELSSVKQSWRSSG
jgi:hypothetical protein